MGKNCFLENVFKFLKLNPHPSFPLVREPLQTDENLQLKYRGTHFFRKARPSPFL
jgi:hypothetical protein